MRSSKDLEELCARLLQADPDIRDIVQFGSSVYAPEQARDIDLLITTRRKKELGVYWDAVGGELASVDLIIREPGERIGDWIARGVCATGRVLYGDGETLQEAREAMPVPVYEEARERILVGDGFLEEAASAPNEIRRDILQRPAFNALFDAARSAVMTYLNTEQTRWGALRRELPAHHAETLRRFIDVLHVRYFYDGEYPRKDVEGEYRRWRDEVSRFIEALASERPDSAADEGNR